ncbi:MAG: putative aminoglycoside phospho-transferase [Pseudonocardiales bacterium]|nr:putative aminoglycoside phospho-transferase [Pseudonocardiales bacterium]
MSLDAVVAPVRTEEELRLVDRIEELLGGRVVSMERQPRWRKAWFVTVDRDGTNVPLYIRGDKQIDAEPYPGLDREAAILAALETGGVPVPHVYGMCQDPIAIVMEMVSGTRDVSTADDDEQRADIAEQYIAELARTHGLDLAPFEAAGVLVPDSPVGVALAFVDANEVLYRRTKHGAEPLVEWALQWARRHVPAGRNHPAFILGDTGQFLFEDGRITCLYDFEGSHVGDPLFDLASLRTRAGFEPLGADIGHLVRHYEKVTGEKVDPAALSYYTAVYMLATVMALSGPLANLRAEDMQSEYLTWDLMTRRALLWAMAEVMEVDIAPVPLAVPHTGYYSRVTRVLEGTIARMVAASPTDEANKAAAIQLAQWAGALISDGIDNHRRDLDRAADILGFRPDTWAETDEALEQYVLAAGPEHDLALLEYFAAQTEERVAEAISIQSRLEGYALPKVVL